MSEAVWVALIGLGGSGIGSLIGVLTSQKLTQYRIRKLEEAVSRHNRLIERTYRLEEGQRLLEERIRAANRRLGELERARDAGSPPRPRPQHS